MIELYPDKYWDQTLIKDLYSDKDVSLLPGAYTADKLAEINKQVKGKTVIVTSDEENKFPIDKLEADRVFMTYPIERYRDNLAGCLPIGYRPETRELIARFGLKEKSISWFFAGQMTHKSREECVRALKNVPDGILRATQGFAQGLDYKEYIQYMCQAKIVPCPAGNVSPDSFRLYEALEAGCIPIPENKEFWKLLFGEVPFPVVDSWDELPGLIDHYKDRPDVNNKCYAWWQLKKRELRWMI